MILVCEWRSEATAVGKLGVIAGLLAGVSYAGVILFLRALRDENSAWLMAINLLATSAVLLPFVIWANIWPNATQLTLLCCFGVFQMGLPYVLFSRGLKQVSSVEASGIVLLDPILLPLWVWLVWRETPAWWTIFSKNGHYQRHVVHDTGSSQSRLAILLFFLQILIDLGQGIVD